MRRRRITATGEAKEKIKQAFRILRKEGLLCRMNFSCCGSCGSAELAEKMGKSNKVGYVFYNRQAEGHYWDGRGIFLAFAGKDTGEETQEVGRKVVAALEKVGANVEWNEDPNRCILVKD